MAISEEQVRRWLSAVKATGDDADLVAARRLEWVSILEDGIAIKLHLPDIAGEPPAMEAVAGACLESIRQGAVRAGERVRALRVQFVNHSGEVIRESAFEASSKGALRPASEQSPPPAGGGQKEAPPPDESNGINATHVIAVGAGKGGVGKSTISVNLAVGLARRGRAVGLLDGDIYGPSLPTLMGLNTMEPNVLDGRFQPFLTHGVKSMTIGKLVDADKPLIWRGPMAHGAFKQLTEKTDWGELDQLVIDLPPGTGDAQLTLTQSAPITGAVIVTTPSELALVDAVKGLQMFRKVDTPVLGLVENMSSYVCRNCGHEEYVFNEGTTEKMAEKNGVKLLTQVPIDVDIQRGGDNGKPVTETMPDSPQAAAFLKLADGVIEACPFRQEKGEAKKGSFLSSLFKR
ncbi:MAG: Mrp/NBP35 family ATP-binding protein [Phycisphaerales bacterium]|nr:Mrp/NBP35 family ATP-binding protein [Phycisphaerales bacterium]